MSQGHTYQKILKDDDFSNMNSRKFKRILALGLAELFGVYFFVLMGCASTIDNLDLVPQVTILNISLTFGLAVASSILLVGHISGGLLNPCLAIDMVVLGHFSLLRCLFYIVMEIAGSILAMATAYAIIPGLPSGFCVAQPNPVLGPWRVCVIEFIMGFFLTFGLCAILDKRRSSHSDSNYLKFAILVVALVIPTASLGGAMNPARAFGPALIGGLWTNHWVYWFPCIFGSITCSFMYRYVFIEPDPAPVQDMSLERVETSMAD